MLLPCARIRLSCLTARYCCAITAPAPSNKAPTATTLRIIGQFSVFPNEAAGLLARAAAYPSIELPALRSIPAPEKKSEAMPALVLADRDPNPLGSSRHVDVIDLVLTPQPLDDSVDDRRTGADRAGLARALDAQRIGLAGHV